ncbi:MAG: N-acetyl-gamma-glutamyl-phosphate reductase [Gammaproteobacteria bacterium]|nr:N-acetyl-gamma-glutamyl-phosphate reductase [Gammaproteobacteria bacterium]
MINVGIVGGTGYTGVELLRLLAGHPQVNLRVITSRSEAGIKVAELFPNLRGRIDLRFTEPSPEALTACDLVFFATPNGTAMKMVPSLVSTGVKIIDLAADFRLRDPEEWQQWYGEPHACVDILAKAVYGLPEVNRAAIQTAQVVANPGCYPTAVLLGFLPLIAQGLVDNQHLIADAKSGVSGAGRKVELHTLLCEASENFKAYGVRGHRHWPEIRQGLSQAAGETVGLTFIPHLVPMIRGIHATLYAPLRDTQVDIQRMYEDHYRDEPFVDVMPPGSLPETRSVRGANQCRIAVHIPPTGKTVVVLSVIDNLVKGAAGQALQNMNIMFGLQESLGLEAIGMIP